MDIGPRVRLDFQFVFLLSEQELGEVAIIPACLESFVFHPDFSRPFLTNEVQSDMAQEGKVFRTMTFSDS